MPADFAEREYCRTCGCHGEPGDAKHLTAQDAAERAAAARELEQRRLGEREESEA